MLNIKIARCILNINEFQNIENSIFNIRINRVAQNVDAIACKHCSQSKTSVKQCHEVKDLITAVISSARNDEPAGANEMFLIEHATVKYYDCKDH